MPRKLNEFYEGIEAPIRKLVKLLRDNGWNTTCSCGHGMWVELDIVGGQEMEVLRDFLIRHGYRDFTIKLDITCMDLWPVRRAAIYVGGYIPCDNESYKELTAKIAYFKGEAEKLYRRNFRLKELLKGKK
jgi:hypothetical protein